MKLYAFRTHKQTAEYYVSKPQQDQDSGDISYIWSYMGVIRLTLYGRGTVLNFYTDEVLSINDSKLRNLRDSDGKPLMESPDETDAREYLISEVDPVTNALGQAEGYRYVARLNGTPRTKRQTQG